MLLRWFENSNGEISDFQLPAEEGNLVKLRPGNYGPIPYLPLKVFGNNDPEDCIKELIVPKSRYFERTKFALSKFLLKKSSEDKIKQSQISIDYGFSMASR